MMTTPEDVLKELAQIGAIETVALGVPLTPTSTSVEEIVTVPHVAVPTEEASIVPTVVTEESLRLEGYNAHLATLGPLLDAFQSNLRALNDWAEKTRAFAQPVQPKDG